MARPITISRESFGSISRIDIQRWLKPGCASGGIPASTSNCTTHRGSTLRSGSGETKAESPLQQLGGTGRVGYQTSDHGAGPAGGAAWCPIGPLRAGQAFPWQTPARKARCGGLDADHGLDDEQIESDRGITCGCQVLRPYPIFARSFVIIWQDSVLEVSPLKLPRLQSAK